MAHIILLNIGKMKAFLIAGQTAELDTRGREAPRESAGINQRGTQSHRAHLGSIILCCTAQRI